MGYENTLPYQQISVSSYKSSPITITTVASTAQSGVVTLPTFNFPLAHAYIDLHIEGVKDTSGADNYLSSGTVTIHDSGAVHRTCLSFNSLDAYCTSTTFQIANYVYPGTEDVAQYLSSGFLIRSYLSDVVAHADNLLFYNCWIEVRLYFGM